MQTSTVIILACLVAVVVAAQYEHYPTVEEVYESELDTPTHENSPRTKRHLLLLKKKILLGVLGLKAAKVGVGAVGAAGVAGALALKGKALHSHKQVGHTVEVHSKNHNHVGTPQSFVEFHDWSG